MSANSDILVAANHANAIFTLRTVFGALIDNNGQPLDGYAHNMDNNLAIAGNTIVPTPEQMIVHAKPRRDAGLYTFWRQINGAEPTPCQVRIRYEALH